MKPCLFCGAEGPYTTREHIIPEALGNDESVLFGEVCDKCQSYLGKEVEAFALRQPPIGPKRVLLRIKGKRGKMPVIDTAIPPNKGGMLPSYHELSDSDLAFGADEDGSSWVAINSDQNVRDIISGEKSSFTFVITPKHVAMLGRLLGKMALEVLCESNPDEARAPHYDNLRNYVRRGVSNELWVIASKRVCNWQELVTRVEDGPDILETVKCYEYGIFDFPDEKVFSFMFGGEVFAISMDRPLPLPSSVAIFAEEYYFPLWDPLDSWKTQNRLS